MTTEKNDEAAIESFDHPVEEFISMQKIMKVHDKLIYKNDLLVEGLGENVGILQKNMKAVNEIIKRMTSATGDVNKLLRKIINRLPKEE